MDWHCLLGVAFPGSTCCRELVSLSYACQSFGATLALPGIRRCDKNFELVASWEEAEVVSQRYRLVSARCDAVQQVTSSSAFLVRAHQQECGFVLAFHPIVDRHNFSAGSQFSSRTRGWPGITFDLDSTARTGSSVCVGSECGSCSVGRRADENTVNAGGWSSLLRLKLFGIVYFIFELLGVGVSIMATDRHFPNTLPDYKPQAHKEEDLPESQTIGPLVAFASTADDDVLVKVPPSFREHLFPSAEVFLKAALELRNEVVQSTWRRNGPRVNDPTMYVGVLGTAFLCLKVYLSTGSEDDLIQCMDIVDACCAAAQTMRPYVTFLCGQPGIYALGAVAAKYKGDKNRMSHYLALFDEVSHERALSIGPAEGGLGMPYELLYGRAGFLWAALFINKHIGEDTIPWTTTGPIVQAVIQAGRAGAVQTRCPLMYQWHGTRYWGAAHGLAGIMHVLLHFPLSEDAADDVKGVLRYMIKNRFQKGNYPSSEGNNRDRLVHWCHGAPGVALTLCKASQVFPEEEEFRLAALEAGEVVWDRGLLRRVGLCHGVSGNAYVFLALHRLFGGKKHLHRARMFAGFLHDRAFSLMSTGEMHGGDHPHSLFEGLAGTACLWLDVAHPPDSRFPGYEL